MIEYVNQTATDIIQRDNQLVEQIAKEIMHLKTDSQKYNQMKIQGYERAKQFSKEAYYQQFCAVLENINKPE